MQEGIDLKLSLKLKEELQDWAEEEFRSLNGQIEFILAEAVKRRKSQMTIIPNFEKNNNEIERENTMNRSRKDFGREFIAKGEIRALRARRPTRTIEGYVIYEIDGREVGMVYMTDDTRSPHYGCCEIYFNDTYQETLGIVWKKFRSNGRRVEWNTFHNEMLKNGYFKFYVD